VYLFTKKKNRQLLRDKYRFKIDKNVSSLQRAPAIFFSLISILRTISRKNFILQDKSLPFLMLIF